MRYTQIYENIQKAQEFMHGLCDINKKPQSQQVCCTSYLVFSLGIATDVTLLPPVNLLNQALFILLINLINLTVLTREHQVVVK